MAAIIVKPRLKKNEQKTFLLISQGFLNPDIRFLVQKKNVTCSPRIDRPKKTTKNKNRNILLPHKEIVHIISLKHNIFKK